MSLLPIVRALGGVLYDGGRRATVPGPGHSAHDRSVSLWLSGGRLVVHSFGRSNWREVIDALRARGLIDASDRPRFAVGERESSQPAPTAEARTHVARRLWSEARPLVRQASMAHVRRRWIERPAPVSLALRHHPELRSAVYSGRGRNRPALLAAVTDAGGGICAVEVTYLDTNGRRAIDLNISRKVIGVLPPACAVRLDPAGETLLVGEGVFTTLSASDRFQLPGWALLSTRNLRTWAPPSGVRQVLIAADRGKDGERSAHHLRRRLIAGGVEATIAWPPPPAEDWNEAAEEGKGRAGRGAEARDRPSADAGTSS